MPNAINYLTSFYSFHIIQSLEIRFQLFYYIHQIHTIYSIKFFILPPSINGNSKN